MEASDLVIDEALRVSESRDLTLPSVSFVLVRSARMPWPVSRSKEYTSLRISDVPGLEIGLRGKDVSAG